MKHGLGGVRKVWWRRRWHSTPVLLPGKFHGQRSLVGCSPWGPEESDTTERLHFHFSLWCIGEGNGNPLPCSCLENPRDGRAWWAAIYGVTQSQTQLKWLSSSSSSSRRVWKMEPKWKAGCNHLGVQGQASSLPPAFWSLLLCAHGGKWSPPNDAFTICTCITYKRDTCSEVFESLTPKSPVWSVEP